MRDLLPTVQARVLEYLVQHQRAHGYAILSDLRGVIGKSSVYDALYRLEAKGFVHSRRDPKATGPRARRVFEVSGLGQTALERHWAAMISTSTSKLGPPEYEQA